MKKTIIMVLVVALIISGCKGRYTDGPIVTRDIFEGKNGLVMEFQPIPGEVFGGSPFRFDVELRNEGAFDIERGYLTLGLESDFIGLGEWLIRAPITGMMSDGQAEFDLKGKSILNPEGSQGMTSVTLFAKEIEALREMHTSVILFTGCYAYQTKLSEGMCIDADLLGTKTVEKACEVEDKSFSSQGAPVAITKIEATMFPEDDVVKPRFLIYIENKGGGEVIKSDVVRKACSGESISYDDFNLIKVNAYLFDKQLKCTPGLTDKTTEKTGKVRLKEKKDEILCVLEEGISKEIGTHTETLNVELDYGYTQTISTAIGIKKVPS